MKTIILCMTMIIAGCITGPTTYSHPTGYKPCSSDLDCSDNQYCGFVAVDTYAVCKDKNDNSFNPAVR